MGTEPLFAQERVIQPVLRGYWKTFAIVFSSFLLMIAIVAGITSYLMRAHIRHVLQEEITRTLTQKARMLANRINADHAHGIDVITSQEGQAAGARATVIDTNGNAVADSEVAVSSLEGEGRLPEFAAALRGTTGVEVRTRNGAQVLLVAVPVSGGAVRLAYPLSDLEVANQDATYAVFVSGTIAAAAAAVLAAGLSRVLAS